MKKHVQYTIQRFMTVEGVKVSIAKRVNGLPAGEKIVSEQELNEVLGHAR